MFYLVGFFLFAAFWYGFIALMDRTGWHPSPWGGVAILFAGMIATGFLAAVICL